MNKSKAPKRTRKKTTKRKVKKAPRRKTKANKTPVYHRRTYMLDDETIKESGEIQRGLRASTASEAIRFAIRKVADMMRHVSEGREVCARPKDGKGDTVVLDIPTPDRAA